MQLKITKWAVAYRKKSSEFLDVSKSFRMIKDSYKGFYADPFLFDFKGDTYLFVEFFDNRLYRGVISYSKYNKEKGEFDSFKEIIRENFHLSYPLVFEFENEIYMMPEANESNSLYIYKAKDFPEVWEKHAVLMNGVKLVDTTPFVFNGKLYALTKRNENPQAPMMLLIIDTEEWRVLQSEDVTDDVSISRPGGNAFQIDDQYYIVTQDCKEEYGKVLNILSFSIENDMQFCYSLLKRIEPDSVIIDEKKAVGIHTYNFSKELEVIDFKYSTRSFYRLFCKLIRKIKNRKI